MGQAAGAASSLAGPASIASLGLGVFSDITKAKGTQAADEMQAARAERAADFGKLQAELTNTHYREQLNTTLSNIDVIRAAANIDPTSPETGFIEDRQRMLNERQRQASMLTIKSQISEDEASAQYLKKAGDFAATMGYVNAGVRAFGAISKGLTSPGGT